MIYDVLMVILRVLGAVCAAAVLAFGFAFLIFLGDANARGKALVSRGFDRLAVLIVYMVLASQFESLIHPFTVILALPLAAVGAFGFLWLGSNINTLGEALYGMTHYAPNAPGLAKSLSGFVPRLPAMNLNLFSQIGLVLLIGLVTKNSILLVEFANQRMAAGLSAIEAMRMVPPSNTSGACAIRR